MADTRTQLAVLANNLNLTAEQQAQLATNLQTFKDQALLALDDDVARAQDGSRLTRAGFNLLGKALAGKQLKFTRAIVGDSLIDGQLTLPTDEEIFELTDVLNRRLEINLGKATFTGGGTAAISFELKNTETTEPIWTREFGIMAEDPDTQEEILYCYRNDGILSQCMPAGGGKVVWDLIITVYTVVAEAANVTAVIDGSMNFVTPHEFDEHVNSTRPHPNIPYVVGGVSLTPSFWVTGGDSNLHPMGLSAVRTLVFSGVNLDFDTTEIDAALETLTASVEDLESAVSKCATRSTALEVNVANLFMQLDTERELGLQPNLLIAEDFVDSKYCDLQDFSVTPLSEPGSSWDPSPAWQPGDITGVGTWLNIPGGHGVVPGRWYTVTDGEKSELVQVRTVYHAVDGRYHVRVDGHLEFFYDYGYDWTSLRLCRTTGTIANGEIIGAGNIRSTMLKFSETWSGTGDNTQVTLTLATTQSNANSFTVTDNGTFSADGEFTLSA